MPDREQTEDAYSRAGVSIDRMNTAVDLIRRSVASTHTASVLSGVGAFGGSFDLGDGTVLVASADGVGTKLRLAAALGRNRGVGIDLVNHCINDILVMGARPLFFLDYFASSKLDPEVMADVVEGASSACRAAGCALLGGETAELPGVYAPGEYDLAGFIVGRARRDRLLDSPRVRPGDVLLALPSSGLHTNGFSLVLHILTHGGSAALDTALLTSLRAGLNKPLADLLLEPHRSYLSEVLPLVEDRRLKAAADITGGGILENLPRVLPQDGAAAVDLSSWTVPPLFGWIQTEGGVDELEMFRVFNMGVGMVLIVSAADANGVSGDLPGSWRLGEVVEGQREVRLEGTAGA